MTTRNNLQSQIKQVRKLVDAQTAKGRKQVLILRAKAADAALAWVMAHQPRVESFRASVRGTPVAKALDALLDAIRGAAHKPAAKKKAAKKTSAKRAARKR